MRKLRLLLFEKCDRSCEGCCNKDWDLKSLDVIDTYKGYDCIMLTGGEPLLEPILVNKVVLDIKKQTNAPIYLYTGKVDAIYITAAILYQIEGITLTLHRFDDVPSFVEFNENLTPELKKKSLRLNVFKGVNIDGADVSAWEVKKDIEWIKNCPLPEGEIFKRLAPNKGQDN